VTIKFAKKILYIGTEIVFILKRGDNMHRGGSTLKNDPNPPSF
jgi:hypothetical protein